MIISVLIVGTGILMVMKSPGANYLIPVVAFIALANAAIFEQVRTRAAWARTGSAALILHLVLGLWHNAVATAAWSKDARQTQIDNQGMIFATVATGCQLVYFYEANAPIYNLSFGNEYADRNFGAELDKIYPATMIYDVFGHGFQSFSQPLSPQAVTAQLSKSKCVRFIGSPVERFSDFGIARETLAPLARTNHGGGSIAVYDWKQ